MIIDEPDEITYANGSFEMFATLPHMVRVLGLDIYARDLYAHYAYLCELNGGYCLRETGTIAKDMGVSLTKVIQAKQALHAMGLIDVVANTTASREPEKVTIPSVWQSAAFTFERDDIPWEQRVQIVKEQLRQAAIKRRSSSA